jgi:hypothetical protein
LIKDNLMEIDKENKISNLLLIQDNQMEIDNQIIENGPN